MFQKIQNKKVYTQSPSFFLECPIEVFFISFLVVNICWKMQKYISNQFFLLAGLMIVKRKNIPHAVSNIHKFLGGQRFIMQFLSLPSLPLKHFFLQVFLYRFMGLGIHFIFSPRELLFLFFWDENNFLFLFFPTCQLLLYFFRSAFHMFSLTLSQET